MSIYKTIARIGPRLVSKDRLFKYGFNLSPMYRRSTGRLIEVSKDLLYVKVKVPISYKNRNYVNSIFGGSMFSAVDPIPMVQLINLLDDNYIIWDKSAEVFFKKPAKETLFAEFTYNSEEIAAIKKEVNDKKEIEIVKTTKLTGSSPSDVYCVVNKKIYVAEKAYFKQKRGSKK